MIEVFIVVEILCLIDVFFNRHVVKKPVCYQYFWAGKMSKKLLWNKALFTKKCRKLTDLKIVMFTHTPQAKKG